MPDNLKYIIYDPCLSYTAQMFLEERWTLEKICREKSMMSEDKFRIRGTRASLNHDRLKVWLLYYMHMNYPKLTWPPGYTQLSEEFPNVLPAFPNTKIQLLPACTIFHLSV